MTVGTILVVDPIHDVVVVQHRDGAVVTRLSETPADVGLLRCGQTVEFSVVADVRGSAAAIDRLLEDPENSSARTPPAAAPARLTISADPPVEFTTSDRALLQALVPLVRDLTDAVREVRTERLRSRSRFRRLDEGPVDDAVGILLNTDAGVHALLVTLLAGEYGDEGALAALREVAGADPERHPDRQDDAELARRILAITGAAS